MTTRAPITRALPRASLLSAALAAALPTLAAAQTPPSLGETVVTATRVEQPISDLVADVSVIDRATIERSGASGVADLLARLPGIEISRNGGVGNTTSLFIRGAETRFTAVYLDGVRIDSQSTGGAPWESIPLAQIDRIEVLRGPAAAVYGSDAIVRVQQKVYKLPESLIREPASDEEHDLAVPHVVQLALIAHAQFRLKHLVCLFARLPL